MDPADFPPPRQRGLTLHTLLIAVLVVIVGGIVILIYRRPNGPLLTIYVVIGILVLVLIPLLAYRLYALSGANYSLDRDRLTLKWGLRVEQIPISNIEWVRPLASLVGPIPLPLFHLPGSVLGIRRHADLGEVGVPGFRHEIPFAGGRPRKAFAISPEESQSLFAGCPACHRDGQPDPGRFSIGLSILRRSPGVG